MASDPSASVNAELAKLQSDYIGRLPLRLGELLSHWRHYLDHHDNDSISQFYRIAHSMAGTAGVLGIAEVSDLARRIEQRLSARDSLEGVAEEDCSAVGESLDTLKQLIEAGQITATPINLERY